MRQYADFIDVRYRRKTVERIPHLRGGQNHRIDYRHGIWSLVRKPGAFSRYRYREELFPSLVFRRAYDALVDARGERADIDYVRVLHLAASTMQADVELALATLLSKVSVPTTLRSKPSPRRRRPPSPSCTSRSRTSPSTTACSWEVRRDHRFLHARDEHPPRRAADSLQTPDRRG